MARKQGVKEEMTRYTNVGEPWELQAQSLYMMWFQPQEIAQTLGRTVFEVSKIILDRDLRKKRDTAGHEFLSTLVETGLGDYKDIIKLSLDNLKRYLTRFNLGEREMEMKEAKYVSDILFNIHQIMRLEQGEATNITKKIEPVGDMKVALREVLDELAKIDPMVDYDKQKPIVN